LFSYEAGLDKESGKNVARKRVTTGIDGLDDILQGGLPENKSYLVAGEPGTGKSTFCMQFLLAGAARGENGAYITIDEKPAHLIEDAEALGWEIRPHIEAGRLSIFDVSAYFSRVRAGNNKNLNVNNIINELTRLVANTKATRLVIDPVAPLVADLASLSDVQEYIRSLIFSIEDNLKCTTLLTSPVAIGSNKLSQFGVEEFAVSGIILLRLVKQERDWVRTLFVRKMRSTATPLNEYAFQIVSRRGLVIRQPL